MKLSTTTTVALQACHRWTYYAPRIQARYMSRSFELHAHAAPLRVRVAHGDQLSTPTPPPPPSFEDIGILSPISAAIRTAFPNVKIPTESQSRFIPAILSGNDVLLKDEPGTGKCGFFHCSLRNILYSNLHAGPLVSSWHF
jgi:hypothetical protein